MSASQHDDVSHDLHQVAHDTLPNNAFEAWCFKGRGFFDLLTGGLLLLVLASFLYGVVMRYVANQPVDWTDEACVLVYMWCLFLAASFSVRERENVAFDMLYDMLSEERKRVFKLTGIGLLLALLLYALPANVSYIAFLTRERTPVLQLPLDKVYFCFVIFLAATCVRLIWQLVMLLTPQWRKYI